MNICDLPGADSGPMPIIAEHFPTSWQAFIWRNWDFFAPEKLADVLECDTETVVLEAHRMGLNVEAHRISPEWLSKGYQTIIRNNWHLLSYEQLLQLLGWSVEQLARALKEEDFLWVKLGLLKPQCKKVVYSPLTQDELIATDKLCRTVQENFPSSEELEYAEMPFSFEKYFSKQQQISGTRVPFSTSFIHAFSCSCGDVFADITSTDPLPDSLLQQYEELGIKGVWIHALLYSLHPIEGAEEYSAGWQKRIENLRILTEKCAARNMKIYLYLNEPRGMPEEFYKNHEDWAGVAFPEKFMRANCVSKKSVLVWMEQALHDVFTDVPLLGGAFFITMSENPTHCNSRLTVHECPLCSKRAQEDLIIDVLAAAERGIHSANPNAEVMAYDWSWRKYAGEEGISASFTEEDVIRKMPRNVNLICASEWGKDIEIGGIASTVRDYSISQVGPSDETKRAWAVTKERGCKCLAKVQVNSSWEMPAVPNLPVPYLVNEHFDNLRKAQVDGLMLSWTLGGFPGGNLKLLKYGSVEEMAHDSFSASLAPKICQVWKSFSDAFRNYPFELALLYCAPMSTGPGNMLYRKPTGYKATMVLGFPYDDLEAWRSIYPENVVIEQFGKMSDGWKQGIDMLLALAPEITEQDRAEYNDLCCNAEAAYCHLRSAYLQMCFVQLRNNHQEDKLAPIISEEKELAKQLLHIVRQDARIGFEAGNHYFYTISQLAEKVILCDWLLQN